MKEKIRSFCVDHDRLLPGIYVSRIDGDVITYDLRMRRPNSGEYLSDLELHSLEHLLATFMRAGSAGERVIYVGPMGCRTGFYLLMRGSADQNLENLSALKDALRAITVYDGPMPGAHRRECGNYRCLSVAAARREAERYLTVLSSLGDDPSFAYDGETENGGL